MKKIKMNKRAHMHSLCNFFPKNRKADKVISVYWFAMVFITAGAVFYMTLAFYNSPKDIRGIESEVLANKIADCISEGGYLKTGIIGNENFKNNLLKECYLNFKVEDIFDWKQQEQYYLRLEIYKFFPKSNSLGEKLFDFQDGNINLESAYFIENLKKKPLELVLSEVGKRKPNLIVLHFTESPNLASAQNEFASSPDKSIHYLVDRDGSIIKGEVEEDAEAFHAGCLAERPQCHSNDEKPNSSVYSEDVDCCRRGINARSIGIEIVNLGGQCGNEESLLCDLGERQSCKDICEDLGKGVLIEGEMWEKYSDEQINSLITLVSETASKYDIPIDGEHIIGHFEVDPGRKSDPGPLFPWEDFMNDLQKEEPLVFARSFYAVDKENNQYAIKILSIIGKNAKNIG